MSSLSQSHSSSSQSTCSSQSQWAQNSTSNRESGIRRVTVRQLLDAVEIKYPQSHFKIDQHCLGKFMLVANVSENDMENGTQKMTYRFDDGTGKIYGYKRQPAGHPLIEPFAYASVIGSLRRKDDGHVAVRVFHIRPLFDAHEIYYHLLHVILDTLRCSKETNEEVSLSSDRRFPYNPDRQLTAMTLAVQNISLSDDIKQASGSRNPMYSFAGLPPEGSRTHGLSKLEQDILTCIKDKKMNAASGLIEHLNNGIDITIIVRELKHFYPGIKATDFWGATEALIEQKLLRIIDDSHYDLYSAYPES